MERKTERREEERKRKIERQRERNREKEKDWERERKKKRNTSGFLSRCLCTTTMVYYSSSSATITRRWHLTGWWISREKPWSNETNETVGRSDTSSRRNTRKSKRNETTRRGKPEIQIDACASVFLPTSLIPTNDECFRSTAKTRRSDKIIARIIRGERRSFSHSLIYYKISFDTIFVERWFKSIIRDRLWSIEVRR